MTDLLLSELVVLLLLLPVLLRPFSKNLKRGNAIPILPFLSLFVCICIIIGQGIVLSLFLLILFVLIVCLSEMIRLIAFSQGVLNDFYGIASVMLRIVLLALFCGIVYCVFEFAPEANVKTEYPLTIRQIELTDTVAQTTRSDSVDSSASGNPIDSRNPIGGLLIERQGGADKKALVIIAEALPYSDKPETLAALLADQGYTVVKITGLEPRGIIPRIELYRKLLPLIGKKGQQYLAKEDNPETAAAFAAFLEKTVARYGRNKRIFLYAEGIYTDLAARFCTENPGVFTGVFFRLSEEEPLPSAPEGWAHIVREQQSDTPADDSAAADIAAASSVVAVSDQTAVSGGNNHAEKPAAVSAPAADEVAVAGKHGLVQTALAVSAAPTAPTTAAIQPSASGTTQPTSVESTSQPLPEPAPTEGPLPFCFHISPYSELAGFGSLRAEDILAAKLLGSDRSIGRQDKAAAAAAFDRYAILF